MIRHEKPKRYELTFLDHGSLGGPAWWFQDDVPDEIPRYEVVKAGWLLAEDKRQIIIAGAKATKSDTGCITFSDVWVVVKGAVIRKKRMSE